jgi:hypothetical protein
MLKHIAPINPLDVKLSKAKLRSAITRIILLPITFLFLYFIIITVANDVSNYVIIWEFSQGKAFLQVFAERRLEIGSFFVMWFLANLFSPYTMIYLTGLLALSIKYYLFNKYLNHALLAYVLYVLAFVHLLDANQLRAALASCVIIYALFVSPKSKYTYFFLTSIAVLFHYSGVIILALYFVRYPILILISMLVAGFVFDTIVSSSPYFSFAMIWYSPSNQFGKVNLSNSFWIMQVLISILCAFNWNTLSEGQKRGALFNMVGVVAYVAFINNPIVAHRVRELTQLGIFAILFLGSPRLTAVKFGTFICFGYIVAYTLLLISLELMLIYDIRL